MPGLEDFLTEVADRDMKVHDMPLRRMAQSNVKCAAYQDGRLPANISSAGLVYFPQLGYHLKIAKEQFSRSGSDMEGLDFQVL